MRYSTDYNSLGLQISRQNLALSQDLNKYYDLQNKVQLQEKEISDLKCKLKTADSQYKSISEKWVKLSAKNRQITKRQSSSESKFACSNL